jgi:hypothetical protein
MKAPDNDGRVEHRLWNIAFNLPSLGLELREGSVFEPLSRLEALAGGDARGLPRPPLPCHRARPGRSPPGGAPVWPRGTAGNSRPRTSAAGRSGSSEERPSPACGNRRRPLGHCQAPFHPGRSMPYRRSFR